MNFEVLTDPGSGANRATTIITDEARPGRSRPWCVRTDGEAPRTPWEMLRVDRVRDRVATPAELTMRQRDRRSSSHSIALSAHLPYEDVIAHFIFDAYCEPRKFELPGSNCAPWNTSIVAAVDDPNKIMTREDSRIVVDSKYVYGLGSVIVVLTEVRE